MWFVRSGARVTGPYSQDQLKALRERGEFSPIHLVSTDKIHWESAAALVQMLDGPPAQSNTGRGKALGTATMVSGAVPAPRRWYYADEQRQTMGPIAEDELRAMLSARTLPPSTNVCREGGSVWEPAVNTVEFATAIPANPMRRYTTAALIATSSVAVLILAIVAIKYSLSETDPDADPDEPKDKTNVVKNDSDSETSKGETSKGETPKVEPPKMAAVPPIREAGDPLLITSLENEDQLSQAVGLVYMCNRMFIPNGSVIEKPISHGTCFACTTDGFLLTNRHVVDEYSPKSGAEITIDKSVYKGQAETIPIVFFNRTRVEAKVVHISSRFDMAILKVDRKVTRQPYFALSSQPRFQRGLEVTALGFPDIVSKADREQQAQLSVRFNQSVAQADKSRTTVYAETSLLNAVYDYNHSKGSITQMSTDSSGKNTIYHNAPIFGGNSGGPLVDPHCRVLGINTQLKTDIDVVGKDTVISRGSVPIAFTVSQFKNEIREHIPSQVTWVD